MTIEARNTTAKGNQVRPTLRTLAYDSFTEALSMGRIKPGQMLSQRELCEMLTVQMGPLREALKRLEAESIVKLIPQRGIQIVDIDEQIVDEVYQIRMLFEVEAVTKFSRGLPRSKLRSLLKRTTEAATANDTSTAANLEYNRGLTALDHEMHILFVSALQNRFAEDAHRRALMRLHLVRFVNKLRRTSSENALQEHLSILRHLLNDEPLLAAGELESHLRNSLMRAKGMHD